MKHLSTVARIITPAAMVVFLAHELSTLPGFTDWWHHLLLVGSFATAIGIEIVGILAGHALEGYWRIGDVWRSLLSFVLLAAYTVTAVVILLDDGILWLVPVIAAIVYLLSSLTEGLETAVNRQDEETAVIGAFDREERAKENEHRRNLETNQQALDAQNQLQVQLAHEQTLADVNIAKAKASASVANAEARKAKVEAELKQTKRIRAEQERIESEEEAKQSAFTCEDCGQGFATVNALNAHGRIHKPKEAAMIINGRNGATK